MSKEIAHRLWIQTYGSSHPGVKTVKWAMKALEAMEIDRRGGFGAGVPAAVLATALALAGCAQGMEGIPQPTSVPPVPLPASGVPGEGSGAALDQEAILAAYHGYWDTWLAANSPPDPAHPGLERYYTGKALDRARASITENLAQGVTFRRPPGTLAMHDASVRHMTGDRAVVDDCSIDDGLIVSSQGEILDARVVSKRSEATLVLDGVWKVEDVVVLESVVGAVPCDAF